MPSNAYNSPLGSQRFVENVGEDNALIKYSLRLFETTRDEHWAIRCVFVGGGERAQPLGALVWKHSLWHVLPPDLYSYAYRWRLADGWTKCIVGRHITYWDETHQSEHCGFIRESLNQTFLYISTHQFKKFHIVYGVGKFSPSDL
jgi:hypothetical protein